MTRAGRLIGSVAAVVVGAAASASCTDDDSSPATTMVASAAASSVPSPPSTAPTSASDPSVTSAPVRVEGRGETPVAVGEPIDAGDLQGRIVFDDFEDVYTMRPDGTDVRNVTAAAGAEFDGAWSPDSQFVVYRDSRRGINADDEIYIARADGTEARNLTNDPGNDWGPDWSSDGEWIIFNSDRDGGALGGSLGIRCSRIPARHDPIGRIVSFATSR